VKEWPVVATDYTIVVVDMLALAGILLSTVDAFGRGL
jgi:hypothetical protein